MSVAQEILTIASGVENISLIPENPFVAVSLAGAAAIWKFESACEGFVKVAQQVEKMASSTVNFFGWKPRVKRQKKRKKCK